MSDKIEPNCLAVTVAHPAAADIPAGYLVRVIREADPDRLLDLLLEKSRHCENCAHWVAGYLLEFGPIHHWLCEFEDQLPPKLKHPVGVFPERMLRRLPPPDIENLTTSKDASVPA